MRKENRTTITEFEVILPITSLETVGEKLKLSNFGEYCPDNSLRGYQLLYLLDHPKYYRISQVMMKGINYIIPIDREKNWREKYLNLEN